MRRGSEVKYLQSSGMDVAFAPWDRSLQIEEDTVIRIRLALLVTALLCPGVLAACGGSSKSSSQGTSPPPATNTAATNATGTTGSSQTGVLSTEQAVETCKHEIQAVAAQLPEGASTLEGTCGRAVKSGTTAEVKKATRELCEGAIEQASGLSASIRERALAECRNRTK